MIPLKYHWTTTSIWAGLYALKRVIQPPWYSYSSTLEGQGHVLHPHPSLPEASLWKLVYRVWQVTSLEGSIPVLQGTHSRIRPLRLWLFRTYYMIRVMVWKNPRTWRQRTWVLALAQVVTSWAMWSLLHLSEPQVAFLSYMGVYFTRKTMREKVFCKLQSMA